MALTHDLPAAAFAGTAEWSVADDLPDLTDRRRLLLGFLFGRWLPPSLVDGIFVSSAAGHGSTTTGR